MTRLAKLLERFANGYEPNYREFERLIEAYGFRFDRARGSHRIFVHPEVTRPLSIQPRGTMAKAYQVEQFRTIIGEFELEPET